MDRLPPEILMDILTLLCLDQHIPTIQLISLNLVSRFFASCLHSVLFHRPIFLSSQVIRWTFTHPSRLSHLRNLNVWAKGIPTQKILHFLSNLHSLRALRLAIPNRRFPLPPQFSITLISLTLEVSVPSSSHVDILRLCPNLDLLKNLNSLVLDLGDSHLPPDSSIVLQSSLRSLSLRNLSPQSLNPFSIFFSKSSSLKHIDLYQSLFHSPSDLFTFLSSFASTLESLILHLSHLSNSQLCHLPNLLTLELFGPDGWLDLLPPPHILDIFPSISKASNLQNLTVFNLSVHPLLTSSHRLDHLQTLRIQVSQLSSIFTSPRLRSLHLESSPSDNLRLTSLSTFFQSLQPTLKVLTIHVQLHPSATLITLHAILPLFSTLYSLCLISQSPVYIDHLHSIFIDNNKSSSPSIPKTWSMRYLFFNTTLVSSFRISLIQQILQTVHHPNLTKVWCAKPWNPHQKALESDGSFQISSTKEFDIKWKQEINDFFNFIPKPLFGAQDFHVGF